MASSIIAHNNICNLKFVSFNMHGFHQGFSVIEDLVEHDNPDIFLLQEHWLTPTNLRKFETYFNGYFSFGSSAMSNCLDSGMLRGRPFATLIRNSLRNVSETVHCSERYVIVRVGNYLLVNIYLPCVGYCKQSINM